MSGDRAASTIRGGARVGARLAASLAALPSIASIASLALLGGVNAAGAQTIALELGTARLRQSTPAESNVFTLGGEARWLGRGSSVAANALGALGQSGSGTFQASVVSSLLRQWWIPGVTEISGLATTFAATGQFPVSTLQLFARQHHAVRGGGLYYGGGGGRSAWAGATLPVVSLQSGGWLRSGPDQITVAGTLTLTQSEFRSFSGETEVRNVYPVDYADASASWQRSLARTRFGASGGVRFGITNVETSSGWASVSATRALTDRISVSGAAGRSPADFVRGVPAARFVSIALRAHSRDAWGGRSPGSAAPAGPTLTVTTTGDRRVVRVIAPSASRVELMADFTNWQPVVLERSGAEWVVEQEMTPGIHRVLIRIDGGDWMVPSNVTRARDDFGGWVGLITVM